VGRLLEPPPCGVALDCDDDGGICTRAELERDVRSSDARALAEEADAGARPRWPDLVAPDRALLGAAYVQGDPPRELTVRNARRHYTMDAGGAQSCDEQIADGTPCDCRESLPYSAELCAVPADRTTATLGPCRIRIDDAHRRMDDVRRHCAVPGVETCAGDRDCCPGLVCTSSRCARRDGG
jgi:hypothetical protein